MTATIPVRVRIVEIDNGFERATSVDLSGLYVAAKTREALMQDVARAIIDLCGLNGRQVSVSHPEQLDGQTFLWRATILNDNRRLSA